jgi:lipooligosaccharide transport system permease protein
MRSVAVLRVVEREALVYRRLWRGSVFSHFVAPTLYLAAMGVGLGGLVDARNQLTEGTTYAQFVAPGLLAATVMQSLVAESLWPVMGGIKWIRNFHAMAATSMTATDIFTGLLVWNALRVMISSAIFLAVALAFGALASPWAVLAIPAVVLCGISFAALVSAFTATQESDERFVLLMRIGVLPLFMFSGTFFPITQLPAWLQGLAWISPLWHGIELCRAATTGIAPSGGAGVLVAHVLALVAFVAVGWLWGTRGFQNRLAS